MQQRAPVIRIFAILLVTSTFALAPSAFGSVPRDVLIVGQIAEPRSLDPHVTTALNDFRILVNLYDGLVRFRDGTLEVEPSLSESWEISEDGTVYTFTLREGVTFHDGTALDAEAVVFNFERMLDENHPYHHTGPFPLAFFFSVIDTVSAIDEGTVEFILEEPFAPFLSNLAYPAGLIVSPSAVLEHDEDFRRNPVGTGAFTFGEWVANQRVVMVRNEAYWNGAPALETVVFRPISDANTRMAEMLSGGIDVMVEVPPDGLARFRTDDRFAVYEQAGPHLWFVILNMREEPFKHKEARQAINYAIDKRALVEDVLQGTAEIAAGPVPPAFAWAYNDELAPYPHDPDRARALLEQAGYDGEEVVFYVAEGGSGMLDPVTMGAAIQADLAAVGMNVRIETYEWNTYLDRVNQGLEGQASMAQMAWMTNDPDTLPFLTLRTEAMPENGGFNSGYYSNPKVDRLLSEARRATRHDRRATLYREMQAIVYEDAPWISVANWMQNAVTSAAVDNFQLQPSFFLLLHDVRKN